MYQESANIEEVTYENKRMLVQKNHPKEVPNYLHQTEAWKNTKCGTCYFENKS